MSKRYPQRPDSHNLEELSRRFFENCLPTGWTIQEINRDYGIDLRVDIFENNFATGLEFLVQLKSSLKGTKSNFEKINLRISTYNLLSIKTQVVILVKFIEEENEAYWIFLKDIPIPEQSKKSFTINITKSNKLSTVSWALITKFVETVNKNKLNASEQIEYYKTELKDFLRPYCGSILQSRILAPADSSENDWNDRDIFRCGFQRYGASIECLCPKDPNFPGLDDYEFEYIYSENESRFKWRCIANPKTKFAKLVNLGTSMGETKEEAKYKLVNRYKNFIRM